MKEPDKKTLENIYLFDGVITETITTFFRLYRFKVPLQNKILQLTEIVRETCINIIDEDEKFYIEHYCKNAIYYASFYVHSVILFSKGYETVNEFCDVDYNIKLSVELPPKTVEKAAKILVKVLDDYYFDVLEFIKNGTLKADNLNYLIRFITGDCSEAWQDEDIGSEELFFLVFQEKSYGFAKFMATYLAIINGEQVRAKGNATKSTEEKVLDWMFSRGK